jgi:hypothetical protein
LTDNKSGDKSPHSKSPAFLTFRTKLLN